MATHSNERTLANLYLTQCGFCPRPPKSEKWGGKHVLAQILIGSMKATSGLSFNNELLFDYESLDYVIVNTK